MSNTQSHTINDVSTTNQNLSAPPLPPRKTSPNVADNSVNRMIKPQTCVTGASSLVNLSSNTNLSTSLSKSSENITSCEFEVPKSNAPPVPKHKTSTTSNDNNIEKDLKRISLTNIDDPATIIVGEAETITGIIDTRPLEARKPIVTNTTLSSSSAIDTKEQKLVSSNCANNLYHLKVSNNQQQQQQQQLQNQQRHQSYPNYSQSTQSTSNYQPNTSVDDSMFNRSKDEMDSDFSQRNKGKFQKSKITSLFSFCILLT